MVDVRRSADRFRTEAGGIRSRHSFSFGSHYDPTNVGHALLVAHNDDVVAPGSGYAKHPHRDLEIVTWVLDGALRHEDSDGNSGLVVPGVVQVLSAGSGVLHSEQNDAVTGPSVKFVQMWVLPSESGTQPRYAHQQVDCDGGLVPVASGMPRHRQCGAVLLGARGAAMHAARLHESSEVVLPDAPYVHVFVARGAADLEDAGRLEEGDAARLTAAGPRRLVAAREGCEVLVWEMWTDR